MYSEEWEPSKRNNTFLENCAITFAIILVIVTFPLAIFWCIRVLQEFERGVIFRLGRVRSKLPRGPGAIFIVPCIDDCVNVDMRTVSFDVPAQEILTRDSVTVKVDAVVYYRVYDANSALLKIVNYGIATRLLAMSTLRNILGTQNIVNILANRAEISTQMQDILNIATNPWGVQVERVEIKDVSLPAQLQKVMAAEAEAAREAKAKIIAAQGELLAAQALKEASDVIIASPAALQLRYLQTLNNIGSRNNSIIVFPVPMEMLSTLRRQ